MSDEEVIETRNHLEMMRRPHLWPGTVLPLKKRTGAGFYNTGLGWSEAVLTCIYWHPDRMNPARRYAVLRGHNMFIPIRDDEVWDRGGDELLVKLISEGWEVD